MKKKFIIEDVYYEKVYDNQFYIYISIKGVKKDLEVGYFNYPPKYDERDVYKVCKYFRGHTFYTESLVKKVLNLVREAIFCEQFLPDSNYKTGPNFKLEITDFQELKRILDKAWNVKIRTIYAGDC